MNQQQPSKPMKIVVVGAGGREHALAWRLACGAGEIPRADRDVVVVPGNAGIARFFRCRGLPTPPGPQRRASDKAARALDRDAVMSAIVDEQPDLVVVGPESFIDLGVVDACLSWGIPCFGPTAAAAGLESSKAFMKDVARVAGIPTADFVVVRAVAEADVFLESRRGQGVVVKADGLAAGKGVVVCDDVDDARRHIAEFLAGRFGDASRVVVVEDRMSGDELSVFALCDGDNAVILGAARDHKRLNDGDTGPNTGGMGAVGPLTDDDGVTAAFLEDVRQRFFLPTLVEMKARGVPFRGVLFAGLMMNGKQPSLLEYNVRFGDPEAEVLLAAYDVDLLPLMITVAEGKHLAADLRFTPAHKVAVVVVAAPGYPDNVEKGGPITGLFKAERQPGVRVFCAGVAAGSFGLVVDGGRVFAVTSRGPTFDVAIEWAYRAVDRISFEGMQVRTDIGASVSTGSQ
jgi:phosphoribosylamine--glycine ligase